MNHVMLDLETWGTRPGCAIRSIGAVFFDPRSDALGPEFYVNVEDVVGERDPGTIAWWSRQSKAAQEALLVNQIDLRDALFSFNAWWSTHRGEYVWSHGANFDQPILEACYNAAGMGPPWSFWNSRCTRTLFDIAGIDTRKLSAGEVKHNAADDARVQARAAQMAYRQLAGHRLIDPAPFSAAAQLPIQQTITLSARSVFE